MNPRAPCLLVQWQQGSGGTLKCKESVPRPKTRFLPQAFSCKNALVWWSLPFWISSWRKCSLLATAFWKRAERDDMRAVQAASATKMRLRSIWQLRRHTAVGTSAQPHDAALNSYTITAITLNKNSALKLTVCYLSFYFNMLRTTVIRLRSPSHLQSTQKYYSTQTLLFTTEINLLRIFF